MSTHCFELAAGKIKTRRHPPTGEPVAFQHDEDLQAVVAGWPWLPKAPALLLAAENDPVYFCSDGGARCDLLGISRAGRAVAVELLLDPFVGRKYAMKSLLRGLCRLDGHHEDSARLISPYSPVAGQPLTAVLVGDGASFPKDVKQVKKIAKDFRALIDKPGETWEPIAGHEGSAKGDPRTPSWVKSLGERKIQFLVLGLRRHLDGTTPVIEIERHLDHQV